MQLTLPDVKDTDWVPLWPVTPRRLRVFDFELALQYATQVSEALKSADDLRSSPITLGLVEQNIDALLESLRACAARSIVNEPPRGEILVAAIAGAAIALAERESSPLRPGWTHPVWHLTLDAAEGFYSDEGGLAAIMALSAAHQGTIRGIAWAETLDPEAVK